jgi:hypothetical protein
MAKMHVQNLSRHAIHPDKKYLHQSVLHRGITESQWYARLARAIRAPIPKLISGARII